jgi:hypothetical protein
MSEPYFEGSLSARVGYQEGRHQKLRGKCHNSGSTPSLGPLDAQDHLYCLHPGGRRAATEEDMLNLVAEPRGNLHSLSDLPVRIPL